MTLNNDTFRKLTKGLKFSKRWSLHQHKSPEDKDQPTVGNITAVAAVDVEHLPSDEQKENNKPDVISSPVTANKQSKKSREKARVAALKQHQEEVAKLCKLHNIHAKGSDIPDPIVAFNHLCDQYGVHRNVVDNLLRQGFSQPTAIQMQCWPLMLKGRELLATAPTGSGKTAAFLLPVLHHLARPRALGFRAVLVAPTRELALQTHRECCALAEGTGLRAHIIDNVDKAIKKFGPGSAQKFDILITTPNRLVHILKDDPPMINLSNVEWLIVDECDRQFEGGKRGFRDQLAVIYKACSGPNVHHAFFSATHANELEQWCRANINNLATVNIGLRNTASEDVEQSLVFCGDESGKIFALRNILRKGFKPPCLVFVETKERARQLFKELVYDGVMVDAIHSERTQNEREACVRAFRAGKIWLLICTELMSRGIDFKGVNLVINYDFPRTLVSYVHRIGRTGRAHNKGEAVTFWTMEDQPLLGGVSRCIRASGGSVPDWMTALPRPGKQRRRPRPDRGHVSEGARSTTRDQQRRRVRQVLRKLALLKTAGEGNSDKAVKLKNSLSLLRENQKKTEKELMQLAKKEELKTKRKRKSDVVDELKPSKKIKK